MPVLVECTNCWIRPFDAFWLAVFVTLNGLMKILSNASWVPDAAVLTNRSMFPLTVAPGTLLADSVFYELHVKGFTKLHPHVPEHLRGTYAGLAHPVAIDYLRELGVTTRVGIRQAADWPLRFFDADSPAVSGRRARGAYSALPSRR